MGKDHSPVVKTILFKQAECIHCGACASVCFPGALEMNRERFRFFRVMLHESDLLVGVPHNYSSTGIEKCVENELIRLRRILTEYSKKEPRFLDSLDPIHAKPGAKEIECMLVCGQKAGTGPMASMAGLFAQEVGKRLLEEYGRST